MRWSRLFTFGGGYPFALAAVAATTALLVPFRSFMSADTAVLFYIPAISVIARLAGVGPSALAAVTSFLLAAFSMVPPYDVPRVASPRDWMTLVVFIAVALVSGQVTGRMRQREKLAVARQRDQALLNGLSARLVSEKSTEAMADFIASEIVAVLGASRCALYLLADQRATLLAAAGHGGGDVAEQAFAEWVARNDKAVGLPDVPDLPPGERPVSVGAADAVEGVIADGVYLPLQAAEGLEGVLYARPLAGVGRFAADELRLLVAIANLAAAFLERQRLERGASRVSAMRESDRLKSTLVSSVSHELKTPLAAVTARVTGLLEDDQVLDPDRVRQELGAVSADLTRLDGSIGDLLDLSRLESDAWRPKPDLHDMAEILGTVLSRVASEQRARVHFDVPEGLPEVMVDFAQLTRALFNLVENALAYSPAGSPIRVNARVLGAEVVTCVEDEGPGVPDADKERVFEKFYRGRAAGGVPSGTGLGLAITAEIVRSNGGRVWVEDVASGGARFAVALPGHREGEA
ncbi:MAG TPA: ATP-binding protein [Coriobacteriia bacterium]